MSTKLLQEGDILELDGRRYMVDYVNDSRVRCVPLDRVEVEVATLGGESASFSKHGHPVNIATTIESSRLLERTGLRGLKEFLAAKASRRKKTVEAKQLKEESTDDMARKTKDTTSTTPKPRGGLAADARRAKESAKPDKQKAPKPEKKPADSAKGKLGQVMGHSTCSVIRRLGKEGASKLRIIAILAAVGVTASPATVAIQRGWGKSGKEKAAELTGDQIKELLGHASEPEPAAKPEK